MVPVSGDRHADEVAQDLEDLLDDWRDEVARTRMRARKWEGGLKDEYRLKGKATGLNIALTELQEALNDD